MKHKRNWFQLVSVGNQSLDSWPRFAKLCIPGEVEEIKCNLGGLIAAANECVQARRERLQIRWDFNKYRNEVVAQIEQYIAENPSIAENDMLSILYISGLTDKEYFKQLRRRFLDTEPSEEAKARLKRMRF